MASENGTSGSNGSNGSTRLLIPNSFQVPNFYSDQIKRLLTPDQWSTLTEIFRLTWGWNKYEDTISVSQICEGTDQDDRTVRAAIRLFGKVGILKVTERKGAPSVLRPAFTPSTIDFSTLETLRSERRQRRQKSKEESETLPLGRVDPPDNPTPPMGRPETPTLPLRWGENPSHPVGVTKPIETQRGELRRRDSVPQTPPSPSIPPKPKGLNCDTEPFFDVLLRCCRGSIVGNGSQNNKLVVLAHRLVREGRTPGDLDGFEDYCFQQFKSMAPWPSQVEGVLNRFLAEIDAARMAREAERERLKAQVAKDKAESEELARIVACGTSLPAQNKAKRLADEDEAKRQKAENDARKQAEYQRGVLKRAEVPDAVIEGYQYPLPPEQWRSIREQAHRAYGERHGHLGASA